MFAKTKTCLSALFCLALTAPGALAQTSTATPHGDTGWSGTLGAGIVAFPKYVGARATQSLLLPIAYVDYNDWFYVDLYRAGAYVWSSQDKKQGISLAVEPRIGFNAGDGPRLAGMGTRRSSVFGGVTYNAEGELGSMSLGYFSDLSSASRGGYLDLLLNRPFVKNERWSLS